MKLTPNETKLTEAMSSALANVDPMIAQALRPHLSRPSSEDIAIQIAKISKPEFVIVNQEMFSIRIGTGKVYLTPDTFKALNDFAVRIGWQCD